MLWAASGASLLPLSVDGPARLLLGFALMMALCHAMGRVAVRWSQPEVLAEIAAGLLLGPSVLGHVAPGLRRWLFAPDLVGVVNDIGQLAVALYAFEIGARLAGVRGRTGGWVRSPLPLGAASALVPAVVGLLLGRWVLALGLGGGRGGVWGLSVFCASALGVTAVPVLARLLKDRGLADTRVGELSLAAAALGDGVCWVLLAVALSFSGGLSPAGLVLGLLAVCCAAVLAARRSGRGSSEAGRRTLLPLLAIVTAAAGASGALGLHPLLGGILAGFLCAPATAEAVSGVRVTAKALLPCFFLAAGQQVDFGTVVASGSFLLLTAALLVVSAVTKVLACAPVGLRYGLSRREALRLGVLMSTKGMTEIVVLTVGYQAGLISQSLFESLLAVGLVLTFLVGPALRLLEDVPGRVSTPVVDRDLHV